MFRSHLTQELQNYFDLADPRARTSQTGLESQLLNAIALPLEESIRRISRELSRDFLTAPLNIDNRGVYHQLQVPSSFALANDANGNLLPPATVQGMLGSDWKTLTAYNDFLPVPSRVEIDAGRSPVVMTSRLLFSVTGDGAPKTVNCTLPMPCRIVFELANAVAMNGSVGVSVTGQTFPPSYWNGGITRSETVVFSDAGYQKTAFLWNSVSSVQISNLPAGATLSAAVFPSLFEFEADSDDYIHPLFRGNRYPRLWSANGRLVESSYVLNRFVGPHPIDSFDAGSSVSSLALEPNTYGLFTVQGTVLSYSDRRTPMPGQLIQTGITQEPPYGLSVHYDTGKAVDLAASGQAPGVRYARLRFDPYGQASQLAQYRVTVQLPDGSLWVVLPDGSLATWSNYAGWRQAPIGGDVSVLLNAAGTYVFTLEMIDALGNQTRDCAPYANLALAPLWTFDIGSLVPEVEAVGFDAFSRFWVWTGSYLVPLVFHYDGYVWDADSRSLFLTDSYPQIQIA